MSDEIGIFYALRHERVKQYGAIANNFKSVVTDLTRADYEYNFDFLGRPIIQMPQDIMAMQEIIWQVQPDLIIETGIAHGGSLIFSAG